MNKIQFTLVLPVYRPRGNWAEQFLRSRRALNAFLPDVQFHYLVVHDGPLPSETAGLFHLVQSECADVAVYDYRVNRGKGYALRFGVRRSTTPFTLLLDFDFPYSLGSIKRAVTSLLNGADVVAGRRSPDYYGSLPLKRKLISRCCATANRLILRLPVSDTQSGLKGFNRRGREIFLQTTIDRFLVDTEFLLRSYRASCRIEYVDLQLRAGVTFSNFGLSVLTTEARNFFYLTRLSFRQEAGQPLSTQTETCISFARKVADPA